MVTALQLGGGSFGGGRCIRRSGALKRSVRTIVAATAISNGVSRAAKRAAFSLCAFNAGFRFRDTRQDLRANASFRSSPDFLSGRSRVLKIEAESPASCRVLSLLGKDPLSLQSIRRSY